MTKVANVDRASILPWMPFDIAQSHLLDLKIIFPCGSAKFVQLKLHVLFRFLEKGYIGENDAFSPVDVVGVLLSLSVVSVKN